MEIDLVGAIVCEDSGKAVIEAPGGCDDPRRGRKRHQRKFDAAAIGLELADSRSDSRVAVSVSMSLPEDQLTDARELDQGVL